MVSLGGWITKKPKRKKKKPTPASKSCGKCVFMTDAGDAMYCELKQIYKKYRTGCKYRQTSSSLEQLTREKYERDQNSNNV